MARIDLGTEPGKRRKKPKPLTATRPRYGRNEQVRGGVKQRSERRLERTGPIAGVNPEDGITGREARKIKRVERNQPPTRRAPQRRSQPRRTVDPLNREVNQEANLLFAPQERQLDYRRRQETQFGQNQAGWYQNYLQTVQQEREKHAAYTKGLQDAAFQQVNQAAAGDQQANQQLLAQQQAQAAQRGGTVDPSLAATMQAGTAARQTMGTAGATMLAGQGQAQTGYLGNRVGVAAEQGIQAGQETQGRLRIVDQLAEELAQQKGQTKVKLRRERQETAHKQQLERAAFGLDVQQERNRAGEAKKKLKQDTREARRRRMEADRKYQLDREKFGEDVARDRYQRTHGLSEYKPPAAKGGADGKSKFTPTQVRSGRRTLRNLVGRVKTNQDPPDSVDPLLARAAVQIADKGGVTPELARKIKAQYGFTPKIKRTTVKRPGNAPAPGGNRPT